MWQFPYARYYYFTHPWRWFKDLYRSLKWAWQRAFRKYDDTVAWSLDGYLCDIIPPVLRQLRDHGIGHPAEMTPKTWERTLNEMIAGFEAGRDMIDHEWENIDEFNALKKDWEQGIFLFREHFFDLWD